MTTATDPQPVAVRILRQLVAEAERAGITHIPTATLRDAIDKIEGTA